MINISRNKLTLSAIFFLILIGTAYAQIPDITVVYPKPEQVILAVDSTFILGHLPENLPCKPKDIILRVNGHEVKPHRDGGFIAFVPVTPGSFTFEINAYTKKDIKNFQNGVLPEIPAVAAAAVTVTIPEPLKSLPDDTLQILGDYRPPSGDLVLTGGDVLEVFFQGTPGMTGWFSIDGVVDSAPVTEVPPRQQPYWGELVFGAGAVPDSLLIKGIYSGFYVVPHDVSAIGRRITYHLTPDKGKVLDSLLDTKIPVNILDVHKKMSMLDKTSVESGYRVSFNAPEYPFTIRFIDSVQIIRHGPRKGYFARFQPEGVEALAVGREGEWYRVKLSETQYAWVNINSVEKLPHGILPPKSYLTSIRTYGFEDKLLIEFPLAGKHPYRIIEDDSRTIRVQLFGVTSDTDWIRYDFSDKLVDIITWSQSEPGLYEVKIKLNRDIWGYDTYYNGNTFYFQLNKAPGETRRLKGKTVVLDPGHSQDPGAIGPTGYTEAEANLGIALVVEHMLKASGVNVVMTRDDNRHVELYERPVIAKQSDADLFVSIHNNALPDGVNPFINNGVSTYYYHPHSIELARAIQVELSDATGQLDYGLYHGNLAVNRPTQYPAVLVECSFMILPEQEARLKTYKFRKQIARAIVRGIEKFLEDYDRDR